MSTQRFEIAVESRKAGKHNSRQLRNMKKVPAVVYGALEANKNICIDENVVKKYNVRAYENALFTIASEDPALNSRVVLIKDVVTHPLTRRPQHVDLFALDLNKTVRISLEVQFQGKPAGLADGGLLSVIHRHVEIECLPTEIPQNLEADVSNLGVGDVLHLSEVKLPPGVKLISSPEMTLATVSIVQEENLTPTSGAAGTEGVGGATAASGAAATGGATAAGGAGASAGGAGGAGGGKDGAKGGSGGGKDKK